MHCNMPLGSAERLPQCYDEGLVFNTLPFLAGKGIYGTGSGTLTSGRSLLFVWLFPGIQR